MASAAAPLSPAGAGEAGPPGPALSDLPDALQEAIWARLGLAELATCACVCWALRDLSLNTLAAKRELGAADLPALPRQLNFLLLGGGDSGGG